MAEKQSPTHPLWAELRMVNAGNGDSPAKVAIVGPEGMAYQFEFSSRHAAQKFRDEVRATAEQSAYLLESKVERTPQGHRLGICEGGDGTTRGGGDPIGI